MENTPEIIQDLRKAIAASEKQEQRSYAVSIGVSDSAISHALTGRKPVSLEVCKALGYRRKLVKRYEYERIQPAPDAEREFRKEYELSPGSRCAVRDAMGGHCPETPVSLVDINGESVYLCKRCAERVARVSATESAPLLFLD